MESELEKDVECSRLFRLLTKLSTVVDRAELNGDESWSEYRRSLHAEVVSRLRVSPGEL